MNGRRHLRLLVGLLVIGLSLVAAGVTASTAAAHGCTPGYWKNHSDSWAATGYAPTQTVGSVFSGADASLSSATLLDALSFPGGSGVVGAQRILLRAGVAALLNAAHPDVDFHGYTAAAIIDQVNTYLATGDREKILGRATFLDDANNYGCPIN